MKNPFDVNPSAIEFLACPPIRLAQANSEREGIVWTPEQCRYAAHAINQHDKLVGMVKKMDEELRDALDCQCYHGFICSNCAILNEAREFITEAGKT